MIWWIIEAFVWSALFPLELMYASFYIYSISFYLTIGLSIALMISLLFHRYPSVPCQGCTVTNFRCLPAERVRQTLFPNVILNPVYHYLSYDYLPLLFLFLVESYLHIYNCTYTHVITVFIHICTYIYIYVHIYSIYDTCVV
jgi:hypothetical protein